MSSVWKIWHWCTGIILSYKTSLVVRSKERWLYLQTTKWRAIDLRMTMRLTFNFKFSRLFSKNRNPGKVRCTFFTTRVRSLISIEEGKAFSRLPNDNIPNIILITCFAATAFSLKLVVEWQGLSRFPAKMTQVHQGFCYLYVLPLWCIKKTQRCKTIHGMCPLGCKDQSIDLNMCICRLKYPVCVISVAVIMAVA